MERQRLKVLVEKQVEDYAALAAKLDTYGNVPLTPEENKLARIATLPALQEAFEIGLTEYLVYGRAERLLEGLGESVHEL